MGRILYDEVSKLELASSDLTLEEIIKDRWGDGVEIYRKTFDASRRVYICWYHNTKQGTPEASLRTARDMVAHDVYVPSDLVVRV